MMRYKDIIAKMREEQIKDFTHTELMRVFKNCVSPEHCMRAVYLMMHDNFTIDKIYGLHQLNLFEVKQ